MSGLASEPSSTMSNQAVSSAKRAFVRFVDEDVLQRRIAASVLNDLKHVTDDPNLAPLRAAITKSQEEQIPYWELRIFVRWLAHRLEAQSYMEIGVRTGWSLLQVAQERPHIELTAFDMWVRDYAAAENSSPTKLRSLLEAGSYAGKARFVSGDSHLTLPAFIGGLDMGNKGRQHGTFDIVTVDGDHSAEGARQDLDLCVDLVKPGGAILFDDLVHEQHPDLLDVWHDFIDAHPELVCFENLRDYPGLGVGLRPPLPSFWPNHEQWRTAAFHPDNDASLAEEIGFSANQATHQRMQRAEWATQLEKELNGVKDDRANMDRVVSRVVGELEAVKRDRDAKAEIVDKLLADLSAVTQDRDAKVEAIERTLADREALAQDRDDKGRVVCRTLAELEAVTQDRDVKAKVVDRLVAELQVVTDDRNATARTNEESQAALAESRKMLAAKETIIGQLGRELAEYRSLGWGIPTVLLRGKKKLRRSARKFLERNAPASEQVRSERAPPHVAIDVLQIEDGVSGGVAVYMRTLVWALLSVKSRVTLLCEPKQLEPLRSVFGDRVAYHAFTPEPVVAAAVAAKQAISHQSRGTPDPENNISFAHVRSQLGVDVLHSPVQIFSRTDFNLPAVLNLHDLQHLHYPENFTPGDLEARNHLYGESACLASAIIATSDFVRNDIINRMGVSPTKVFTVPAAVDPEVEQGLKSFTPEQAQRAYNLPALFGLYPAAFWVHKNHARLVEALSIVRQKSPEHDFKLVFTGYRGHSGWPTVENALKKHDMTNHVILLDHVPTGHLGALYRAATFCIVPTLFEASSYPVIEAQTLGCAAMCSRVTSLPELMVGDAGLLFDPHSPTDMAECMLRWLEDPEDRLAHAERGQRRARREHSLDAYAKNILNVYNSTRQIK
ncbi:MAG: hypothetical protein A2289_22550 [Deltaproteobacteria bacterium RIFOXYA12_FULL_58_15]|nr:MAG: hypothetical protein A2289_22550 [Deltaproteobacteria bacterium RIFOXYA12_FULL_58_15]OGR15209.1 MAG: hypothetical protein A2341_08975 [Deltaproteobacteria bacterium RIFOXYB12_FULL_58_9]